MDIFNEILWPQFKELTYVRSLPLNEQVQKYNQYLNELAYQRTCYQQQIDWLNCNKGGRRRTQPQEEFFLLQENGDYLLQENNDKIIIT